MSCPQEVVNILNLIVLDFYFTQVFSKYLLGHYYGPGISMIFFHDLKFAE